MKQWKKVTIFGAFAALIAASVSLSACGWDKASEPWKDAPRGTVNDQPADVGTMPDGFSNYSTKCDHGNRVYVIFHGDSPYGSIAVVPQDPTCAK
jgi:hypothetical protein